MVTSSCRKLLILVLGGILLLGLSASGAHAASTFTVINTAASGSGSLEDAINQVNADTADIGLSTADTIQFDLTGPTTILVATSLPTVSRSVIMKLQTGTNATIENNGSSLDGIILGGGVVAASISGLTISGFTSGAGILIQAGTDTVSDCLIANNFDGISHTGGTLTVSACTFTGNVGSTSTSAGILESSATVNVYNDTFTANVWAVIVQLSGVVVLTNDILFDDSNGEISGSANATFCDIDGGFLGTDNINKVPLLSPLGSYGGPTQTFALLPGSPCLGIGTSGTGVTSDQRGVAIPEGSRYDIGSFESQGFTVTPTTGTPQSTGATKPFPTPLAATVAPVKSGDPVNGGLVTFTAPLSGPSATITGNPATVTAGAVSVTATATAAVGAAYNVVADTGAGSASFVLINIGTPTAAAQTAAVAHNTAANITLVGDDTEDSPTLPLTFAVGTGPSHGALGILNTATGAVTYTPTAGYSGPDSFTFTVSNGVNTSAPATVTLNVATGTPTATPQTVPVSHDTAAALTLAGSDAEDSPALPLTFAIGTPPTHGTLGTLNTTSGAVTYTPTSGFQGSDSFTFTVSNGTNLSTTTTVTLHVAPATPTATPQTAHVAHDTATTITLGATDGNDNPALSLTFTLVNNPTNGTLTNFNSATGTVTYTPNTGFYGPDSFTFTVGNGTNSSSASTVDIVVAPVTPSAQTQAVPVAHNAATTFSVTGTDGDDNPALPLTFVIGTSPANGSLSGFDSSTGAVTYTPNAGFYGADTFTFTASNGTKTGPSATVTLNVGPAVPTATPQSVSVTPGDTVAITLAGVDGDDVPQLPLTFAVAVAPSHGTLTNFDATAGTASYKPNTGYAGIDTFTFTASNGTTTSAPATITITIVAGIPTAATQSVRVAANSTNKPIVLAGADPDSLAISFAIGSSPAHGTLSGLNTSTGAVNYTPNANYFGADSFTFTVTNGTNTSSAAIVSITVTTAVPTASPQSAFVSANTTATSLTLSGTDPDNLPLTYSITSNPAHGTLSGLNVTTGVVNYAPATGFVGTDSFGFTVTNIAGATSSARVSITIVAGTPKATAQTDSVTINTTSNQINLAGTDPTNLPLTFAIVTNPTHGTLSTFNSTTGAVFYTPTFGYLGADSFTFTVNNGTNTSTSGTVTINVLPGTPTATAQSVKVSANSASDAITLKGVDPEGLPLTFAIGTSPAHGTLTGLNTATGSVTYSPSANYFGPDSFTFTASNGTNTSTPSTVTITVTAGAPTASAQSVTVAANSANNAISLVGSDPDGLPLTFAVGGSPAHGTLSGLNAATGAVIYAPATGYVGSDSFSFTVHNGTNSTAAATVTISVTAGIPIAVPQTVQLVADSSANAIQLHGGDPENLPVTYILRTGPTHGVLSGFNTTNGNVTYTPDAGYFGDDSFTFAVSNGTNTSVPATVGIFVTFSLTLQSGLQMISLPYSYTGVNLDTLFGYSGVTLAVWEPSGGQYAVTPTPPADQISLGQGYWVRLPQDVTITQIGTPAPAGQTFTIDLAAGWNMIGDPFTESVPLSSTTFGPTAISFAVASGSATPIVASTLWAFPAGATSYSMANSLDATQGYWIFANQATTMNITAP